MLNRIRNFFQIRVAYYKINRIYNLLAENRINQEIIMSGLSDLQAAVTAQTAGVQAAVMALQAAVAAAAAGDNDAAVGALAATVAANNATLAAAVDAATPAPPAV